MFVSCDHSEEEFFKYYDASHPWTAVPFDDPAREELQALHKVSGIPALKVLSGRTGEVIEANGAQSALSEATLRGWEEKAR